MIAIRLSRYGHKNSPFYRIVAVDSRKKAVGAVLAILGTYNPKNKALNASKERINEFIKKGAQVSATVKKLLK